MVGRNELGALVFGFAKENAIATSAGAGVAIVDENCMIFSVNGFLQERFFQLLPSD